MIRVITGSAKGKHLAVVEGTRPPTDRIKANIFDLLQEYVTGARVLDLFAGSGAMGIEALSRGAKTALFIEKSAEACAVITKNLADCRFQDRSLVITATLPQYLHKNPPSIANRSAAQLEKIGIIPTPDSGTAVVSVKTFFSQFELVFCDPPFTELEKFCLQDYADTITPTNLFVLRLEKDYSLAAADLAGLKIEYTKLIGLSTVYFIRKIG